MSEDGFSSSGMGTHLIFVLNYNAARSPCWSFCSEFQQADKRPSKVRSQEIIFLGLFLTGTFTGTVESSVCKYMHWDLEKNSLFSVFTAVFFGGAGCYFAVRTKTFLQHLR